MSEHSNISNVTATLYDVTGREIVVWNNLSFITNEQAELPLQKNIQSGIYFLSIKNSNANFVVKLNHL
nr:T9SS type A sorting domain-containing protein [Bacteroidota bacterium]